MTKTKQEMVNEIIALYNDNVQDFKRSLEAQDFVSVWETYVKHGLDKANSMGVQSDAPKSGKPLNFKVGLTSVLMGFFIAACALMCYDFFSAVGEWAAVNFK